MSATRRVNSRDIAQSGSLATFIDHMIEHMKVSPMEMKEKASMLLDSLCQQPMGLDGDQVYANAVLIARAGAIKHLVALVIIGSPIAQLHACNCIAEIAKRSEYQEQVVLAGGVLPISTALRAGDPGVQEGAAAAIASISQLVSSQHALIKAGAVLPLVTLLKGASDDTHMHVCFALANLADGNSEGQDMIAKTGAIPLLIGLLGSGKAQEAVATAVAKLTQNHEVNQAEVTKLGGVPRLIALLSSLNTETQAQAAAALAALASGDNRDEQDVIAQAGGISPLLALVESRYASAQCSSINALAMMAVNNRDNQESIATMNGIIPLVALTHTGAASSEVQAQAVLALTEVSRHNHENQTTIADNGALSSLAALMRNGDSQAVKAEVAGSLWTLSENHPENRVSIASAGAIQPLIAQLAQPSERAQTHAANALASLAYGNTKNQAEIAGLLVAMLEEPPGGLPTAERAVSALWRIVGENPENEAIIAAAGGAQPLVRLLRSKQARAKSYALWSLSLSIDADNQKLVADEDGVTPLVAMLNDRQQLVCEQAACAIKRLALNNKDTQTQITKAGAVEPLITLLDGDGADRAQEYAAAALSELAQIVPGKAGIDRGGGIQPLVALLSDSHRQPESKRYAAAALARLSGTLSSLVEHVRSDAPSTRLHACCALLAAFAEEPQEEQNQKVKKKGAAEVVVQSQVALPPKQTVTKSEMIANAGAITPLVNLLNGTRGEEAQQESAGALWALADHENNRMAITEAGGIAPLVALLGCENGKAREHAELALVRLSIEGANRVIIIEQLVGMLADARGTAAQEQAAAALANLARESEDNRTSIRKADGIPRLLNLLSGNSVKAKENSASAISELAHKNVENQRAIANAGGIPKLVATLIAGSADVKNVTGIRLCTLIMLCIWHMADGNKENQTALMKEGAIPPVVAMVTNPDPEMQTNAAGSLACLCRDHPDNQAAIARSGAIPPLCTMVREGAVVETREESAAALWALATDNAANKSTIAKLGGIEPLVNMLMYGQSENSSIKAAGALAALAAQHSDNRQTITKRMVNVLGSKAPATRAVRLLSALASLCDNEPTNQVAIAKTGGVTHLIVWLANSSEEVQVQAARAMLAVSSNNNTTQSLIGKLGGIPPLVMLVNKGTLEAQENAACTLWHLATLRDNRALIKDANGIPPVVGMLLADGQLAPQVSAMLLMRLAEGSTKAAVAIAQAGGIPPLVRLLSVGSPATQQMAAASISAMASISQCRDTIANAGAIEPLIKLIWSTTMGTPETAARCLSFLAQNELDDDDVSVADEDERGGGSKEIEAEPEVELEGADPTQDGEKPPGDPLPGDKPPGDKPPVKPLVKPLVKKAVGRPRDEEGSGPEKMRGGEERRGRILEAGALSPLIRMLDGSNLKGSGKLKSGAVGGWAAVRVGVAGAIELSEIFPGSQVNFGVRIGMQEQAAATLADLAFNDFDLQDAIIEAGGVSPLLSLVQYGSAIAQEYSARTTWYLASSLHNQHVLVNHNAIQTLVDLVKTGTNVAPEMAAAALSVLAHGYIEECGGVLNKKAPVLSTAPTSVNASPNAARAEGMSASSDVTAVVPADAAAPSAENGIEAAAPSPDALAPHAATQEGLAPAPAPSVEFGVFAEAPAPSEEATAPVEEAAFTEAAATPADEETPSADDAATDIRASAPSAEEAASEAQEKEQPAVPTPPTPARERKDSRDLDRLLEISNAGGIQPLVKLADSGSEGGKEKAASALWHMALDPECQLDIASNGGIKPLVSLLAEGTARAQRHASDALTRLATSNPENQAQIAKKLVGLLDSDDAGVVSRAAHDLQALAQDHAGAPVVIVNAGAISPLVTVLSNGKTHEGRQEAAKTLQTLANSGAANQLAIAVGLVALLGVGTDEAQEYVTALLLELSSGIADNLHNRRAIANAGPFKMLVQQFSSDSVKVKSLAAAVMSKLSGDSDENVTQIAAAKGIKPLVFLLDAEKPETQADVATILADMTCVAQEHAVDVAKEGGIPKLVALLTKGHTVDAKAEAAGALSSIAIGHALEVGKAGSIAPLVELLKSGNRAAEKQAASAIAGIALGGQDNQDAIEKAGAIKLLAELLSFERGPELVVSRKLGKTVENWEVQAQAARALGALGSNHANNQNVAAAHGVLEPIIALITKSECELPKELAAFALWRLSSRHASNQAAVADACGISALVTMVGSTTVEGQRMAVEALASLALNHVTNQTSVSERLINLLTDSPADGVEREKAARAISRFVGSNPNGNGGWDCANATNQDALAVAGAVELIVSLLEPHVYEAPPLPTADAPVKSRRGTKEEVVEEVEVIQEVVKEDVLDGPTGKHHLIHTALASALWSLSYKNSATQKVIAKSGGLQKLIALIDDDPGIHRDAAGALWSLADDEGNRKLSADEGAIPHIVELLTTGKKNNAQETAAGALRVLAKRPENRIIIAQAGGIKPAADLFDGGTEMAKTEVIGALLVLAKDNLANQFEIVFKMVALLQAGPDYATEASNVAAHERVKAQEEATNVIYQLSLERENKEALSRSPAISQLVRMIKGGSDRAQQTSADALTQMAVISPELRNQVTQQLIPLLSSTNVDVRKRAGAVLHAMNTGPANDDKDKKEATLAGGVAPIVELFKDGLKNDRLEPQEYALWSLAFTVDQKRNAAMVSCGIVPALIAAVNGNKIPDISQEYAVTILSCIALDHGHHEEIIQAGAIAPMVRLLDTESIGIRRHSATFLARLALGDVDNQTKIAAAGALKPLVEWLVPAKPDEQAVAPRVIRKRTSVVGGRPRSPDWDGRPKSPDAEHMSTSSSPDELRRSNHQCAEELLSSTRPSVENMSQRSNSNRPSAENMTLRSSSPDNISPQLSPSRGRPSAEELLPSGEKRPLSRSRQSKEDLLSAPVKPPVPRELKAVAAMALADLARDNNGLQAAISEAGALQPLILMLSEFTDPDGQKAACGALATLSQGSAENQITIAQTSGIPPLIELLKSTSTSPHENAARAISMLALDEQNKTLIAVAGGLEPLVQLITSGSELTKQHAAYALESLLQRNADNQATLAGIRAYVPLVSLLSSESSVTAESAVAALICLGEHASSQKAVIRKLVECLNGKSITAQLKAAEALAKLSCRNATFRAEIVKAGAITPLVGLLGTGQRADLKTPPERAAAVLADLSRIAESKTEISRAGGIMPLVNMLASRCEEAQTNATVAVYHLSTVADNKVHITSMKGIQLLARILSDGSAKAQHHAAGAVWQLANSADNRAAIVEAGGIPKLITLVSFKDPEVGEQSVPTPRRRTFEEKVESEQMLAKESAAAVLAELARSQSSFRSAIVKNGGIAPLTECINSTSVGAQKWATSAIWGLSGESKYQGMIAAVPGAVERLVELLRKSEGETQGYAAAALVCLAKSESVQKDIKAVGGAGPLMTIALGPASWLRSQCVDVLKLLGYDDPSKKVEGKVLSPRMVKLQEKLAANADVWMISESEQKAQPIVNEEHMSEIAVKLVVGARVIVSPGDRRAEVMYVGKIHEIAAGYWIGVQYDEVVGKNDGSIRGHRYFDCAPDCGGFLRPDHVVIDSDPPPPRSRKIKDEEGTANAPATEDGKRKKRGSVADKTADAAKAETIKAEDTKVEVESGVEEDPPDNLAPTHDSEAALPLASAKPPSRRPRKTGVGALLAGVSPVALPNAKEGDTQQQKSCTSADTAPTHAVMASEASAVPARPKKIGVGAFLAGAGPKAHPAEPAEAASTSPVVEEKQPTPASMANRQKKIGVGAFLVGAKGASAETVFAPPVVSNDQVAPALNATAPPAGRPKSARSKPTSNPLAVKKEGATPRTVPVALSLDAAVTASASAGASAARRAPVADEPHATGEQKASNDSAPGNVPSNNALRRSGGAPASKANGPSKPPVGVRRGSVDATLSTLAKEEAISVPPEPDPSDSSEMGQAPHAIARPPAADAKKATTPKGVKSQPRGVNSSSPRGHGTQAKRSASPRGAPGERTGSQTERSRSAQRADAAPIAAAPAASIDMAPAEQSNEQSVQQIARSQASTRGLPSTARGSPSTARGPKPGAGRKTPRTAA